MTGSLDELDISDDDTMGPIQKKVSSLKLQFIHICDCVHRESLTRVMRHICARYMRRLTRTRHARCIPRFDVSRTALLEIISM